MLKSTSTTYDILSEVRRKLDTNIFEQTGQTLKSSNGLSADKERRNYLTAN